MKKNKQTFPNPHNKQVEDFTGYLLIALFITALIVGVCN